ncbi:MAG: LysE/ArgO family amino acid transporter [Propionibacteriaceae bacterium]|jgi:L-lysine exporter family protein LysE/ArgO|nr:LysE/ArgO family amino acid transporter [Propionibacteriaceae bacterium]
MLTAALAGLGSGFSLIVAIGAQNAFVLRQGIRREHIFAICLLCALSDAVLITLGIVGLGALVERAPIALDIMRWAGVVFLLAYAVFALKRAMKPKAMDVDSSAGTRLGLGAALAQAAAFTYLNPHVYLDTVMLLGSIANTHGPTLRWWFAAGAVTASVLWFFGLGYGARLLAPLFAKPLAWRVLDVLIAAVMVFIAVTLALG